VQRYKKNPNTKQNLHIFEKLYSKGWLISLKIDGVSEILITFVT